MPPNPPLLPEKQSPFQHIPALKREITHCDKLIEAIYREAGVKRENKIYRPGCGFFNEEMLQLVEEEGYTLVLGSVYPHDPLRKSVAIDSWYIKKKLEDRDIVIIHDRSWTPALLVEILPWIEQEGYEYYTETFDHSHKS